MNYVTDPKFLIGAVVGIVVWTFVLPLVKGMFGRGGRGQGEY